MHQPTAHALSPWTRSNGNGHNVIVSTPIQLRERTNRAAQGMAVASACMAATRDSSVHSKHLFPDNSCSRLSVKPLARPRQARQSVFHRPRRALRPSRPARALAFAGRRPPAACGCPSKSQGRGWGQESSERGARAGPRETARCTRRAPRARAVKQLEQRESSRAPRRRMFVQLASCTPSPPGKCSLQGPSLVMTYGQSAN